MVLRYDVRCTAVLEAQIQLGEFKALTLFITCVQPAECWWTTAASVAKEPTYYQIMCSLMHDQSDSSTAVLHFFDTNALFWEFKKLVHISYHTSHAIYGVEDQHVSGSHGFE